MGFRVETLPSIEDFEKWCRENPVYKKYPSDKLKFICSKSMYLQLIPNKPSLKEMIRNFVLSSPILIFCAKMQEELQNKVEKIFITTDPKLLSEFVEGKLENFSRSRTIPELNVSENELSIQNTLGEGNFGITKKGKHYSDDFIFQ